MFPPLNPPTDDQVDGRLQASKLQMSTVRYTSSRETKQLDESEVPDYVAEISTMDAQSKVILSALAWVEPRLRKKLRSLQVGTDTEPFVKRVKGDYMAAIIFRTSSKPINFRIQKPLMDDVMEVLVVVREGRTSWDLFPVCKPRYTHGSCTSKNLARLVGVENILNESVLMFDFKTWSIKKSGSLELLNSLRQAEAFVKVDASFRDKAAAFSLTGLEAVGGFQDFSVATLVQAGSGLASWSASRWKAGQRVSKALAELDYSECKSRQDVMGQVERLVSCSKIHLPVIMTATAISSDPEFQTVIGKFRLFAF